MLFVAGSAILFASKGLFGKALYQRGVGFELLVTVRAVMAVPLFAWFALRANAPARAPEGAEKPPPMRPRAISRRPSPESPATTSARWWISGR